MRRLLSSVALPAALLACGAAGPRPLSAPPRPGAADPAPLQTRAADPAPPPPSAAATSQLPPGPLRGVRSVSAGHGHACALRTDGRVVCWGENGVGQAGAPIVGDDTRSRPHLVAGLPASIVEVAAGSFHTCARDEPGAVWCWGRPDLGLTRRTSTSVLVGASEAGAPSRVADSSGPLAGVRSLVLAPGSPTACAVRADDLSCWQTHAPREQGRVDLRAQRWPGLEQAVVGRGLRCGLVAGAEGRRRIECADGSDAPTPVRWPASARDPVDVTLGTLHLCALDAAGAVLCWRAAVDARWWQRAPQAIQGLGGGQAVSLSAGGDFACAAARDGSVACFLAEPAGLEEETVRTAWAAPDQVARTIPGVARATTVSAGLGRDVFGHGFACAVLEDTTVACWGDDESGELGGDPAIPARDLAVVVTAP